MDSESFGLSLNLFLNAQEDTGDIHIIVAGLFKTPSELTSQTIIDVAKKIIEYLDDKGLEAAFEYEFNARPVVGENVARFFKLKFENGLNDLQISCGNLTVSATTDFQDSAEASHYATI